MAFGKKKGQEREQAVAEAAALADVAPEDDAPDSGGGEAIDGAMFASGEDDAEGTGEAGAGVEGDSGPDLAAEATPEVAPSADPLGGADLLSMFQTTTVESDDKAALLELAGEVAMDDLLEELQTVSAALGRRRG